MNRTFTITNILILLLATVFSIILINQPKEKDNISLQFYAGKTETCYGIYTIGTKSETIKWLTKQNDNKTIYPLVLTLGGTCPYKWSKTYYNDSDFPNESVCFEGSCLIKYEDAFRETAEAGEEP